MITRCVQKVEQDVDVQKVIHQNQSQYIESLNLNQYLVKNETLNQWECSFCGKTSRFAGNIKKHVEIHIDGLEYSCSRCNYVFTTRISLNNHRKHCPH